MEQIIKDIVLIFVGAWAGYSSSYFMAKNQNKHDLEKQKLSFLHEKKKTIDLYEIQIIEKRLIEIEDYFRDKAILAEKLYKQYSNLLSSTQPNQSGQIIFDSLSKFGKWIIENKDLFDDYFLHDDNRVIRIGIIQEYGNKEILDVYYEFEKVFAPFTYYFVALRDSIGGLTQENVTEIYTTIIKLIYVIKKPIDLIQEAISEIDKIKKERLHE